MIMFIRLSNNAPKSRALLVLNLKYKHSYVFTIFMYSDAICHCFKLDVAAGIAKTSLNRLV